MVAQMATAIANAATKVALTGFSRPMSAVQFKAPDFVQACQAILAIKYVDDVPHDRTSLFDPGRDKSTGWFPGIFAEPRK